MGWETRGNGRYYYQKTRHNDRVVSEYIGTGPLAELIAQLDFVALERHRQADEKRKAQQAVYQQDQDLDRMLDQVGNLVRQLTAAVLLTTGHYAHRGQWRKGQDA